jgi:hypothetical protein
MYNKIDYKNKHGMMVGYIDGSQNVSAVQTGWDIKPESLSKLLLDKYPTKEDAMTVVDSPLLVPVFKKDDYEYVDGYGDVIESNLSWHKENMRKDVGHLFLFMKGTWQYSDNGIDWEPANEAFIDTSGVAIESIREVLETETA